MNMNRKFITALATTALILSAGVVGAQTYTLSVTGSASVGENSTFSATCELTFDGASDMSGWSYGICSDPAFVTLDSVDQGPTVTAFDGGDGPGFFNQAEEAGGYSIGLVIDLFGLETLAPGNNYQLSIGNYTSGLETPSTVIAPCDTLGTPPVVTVVVVNGASITPVQEGLDLAIVGQPDPAYSYIAPNDSVNYNPADGMASFVAGVIVDQDDNGAPESDTQGFSMGLGNDASLLTPTDVVAVNNLATINGGAGPDFFTVGLFADGWTVGVVYALLGGVEFPLQDDVVIDVTYETNAATLAGDMDGEMATLGWTNGLGARTVDNVVVVGGGSLPANFVDGTITLNAVTITIVDFRRGDSNEDGIVNIADGIWVLNALFQGGPSTDCDAASDANGDGNIDSTDAVYIFNWRFSGGPPPPAPFPDCGTFPGQLPAPDDCNEYNAC